MGQLVGDSKSGLFLFSERVTQILVEGKIETSFGYSATRLTVATQQTFLQVRS